MTRCRTITYLISSVVGFYVLHQLYYVNFWNSSEASRDVEHIKKDFGDTYPIRNAYSIWIIPPHNVSYVLQKEIIIPIANKYLGSFHQPHIKLVGPIYDKSIRSILEISKTYASSIGPIDAEYDTLQHHKYEPQEMWKGNKLKLF